MDIDIATPNRTVYIRQIVSRPTATYYTANGTDTSSTTCPWGDAKTAGSFRTKTVFPNGIPITEPEQKDILYQLVKAYTKLPFEDVLEQ